MVEISRQGWATPTSTAEAYRRAGGRRRWNATRRARAEARRLQVMRLLAVGGYRHGVQVRIARRLGVSEATISRDLRAIAGTTRAQLAAVRPRS